MLEHSNASSEVSTTRVASAVEVELVAEILQDGIRHHTLGSEGGCVNADRGHVRVHIDSGVEE